MNNKIAIVTGAASGIGNKLAHTLLAEGYNLVLADINIQKLETDFYTSKNSTENNPILRKLDVREKVEWQELISETVSRFGKLDYLFNIAGYIQPSYIHQGSADLIDSHIDINTKGTMYGSKFAAEEMIKINSGHIINISSLAGVAPISGISAYSASKYAVRGFSLAIAQELKRQNVFVSVICPDLVDTPMLDLQLDYKEASLTFSGNRILNTQDVVKAILKVMHSKKAEIMLPASRGWLARIANIFPSIQSLLTERLSRKGYRKIKQLQTLRNRDLANY